MTTAAAWVPTLRAEALDPHRQVQQLADFGVRLVQLPQVVALFQGFGEGDFQFLGHQGDDGVDARDRQAQGAAHVADRRPGGQGPERADLGDVLHAVLFLDVLDHLAATLLAEVDVDVGRLAAALVQESLEEQVVFQRTDVAQSQGVGDQRPHAGAAGRRLDALGAGEADEIPDDEEVVGEAELVDHVEFTIQPRHHLGRQLPIDASPRIVGVSLPQPFEAQLPQPVFRGDVLRQGVDGKVPAAKIEVDGHAVGDLLAAAEGLFPAGKRRVHLLRRAKIELVAVHLHPVRVAEELARVDAQEHVLRFGVLAKDVVHVAGGHGGQAHAVGQVRGRLQHHPLHLQPVVLQLDEVTVAEDLLEPGDGFVGPFRGWLPRRPGTGDSIRWKGSR